MRRGIALPAQHDIAAETELWDTSPLPAFKVDVEPSFCWTLAPCSPCGAPTQAATAINVRSEGLGSRRRLPSRVTIDIVMGASPYVTVHSHNESQRS